MQAKLLKAMDTRIGENPNGTPIIGQLPAGHILDHPKAYMQVRMGCAIPHDEECRIAANITPEEMAAAQQAQKRTAAGIHPDDFAAFDAGRMIGYNPETMEHIPGPNARKQANKRTRSKRRRHRQPK